MRTETLEVDVLVVGGGAAGCTAALKAHEFGARVLMVVKGKMGRSGATPLAAHLAAAPPVPGPYPVLHQLKKIFAALSELGPLPLPSRYRRLLETTAGQSHYWLVDQEYMLDAGLWTAKVFPELLEKRGLYVLRDEDGKPIGPPDQTKFVSYKAGMSGYQFGEFKRKEVLATGINVMEEAMVFSVLTGKSGEAAGAMVLDYANGRLYAVRAKSIVLATGHTNWLSKRATGTREMAANGLAMAARVGTELQNLEIQWFHASDSAYPDAWMRLHHFPNRLLGTRDQAVMVNSDGEVYMRNQDYDISMPYTVQMKALYQQVKQGKARWDGGSFADYRLVDSEIIENRYYHSPFYERLGKSASNRPLECAVTWHMSAGGVRADVKTLETNVPGLFIAGPVGGHQLGGLNFASYDGLVAGTEAARRARAKSLPDAVDAQVRSCEEIVANHLSTVDREGISPIQVKKQVREIVWENLMYAKNAEGLNQALDRLKVVEEEVVPRMRLRTSTARYNTDLVDALDVRDMIDVTEMVIHAALSRQESRGPHFREDFPFTDNDNWLKYVVVSRVDGSVRTRLEPVRQKYVRPESGVTDYFADPYA